MTTPHDHLVQLRARVDQHFANAVARSPDRFECRDGCAQCCHRDFSVFAVEAKAIAAAWPEVPATTKSRVALNVEVHPEHCAFLVNQRCAVYDARPIICRSHGLTVRVGEADGEGTRDDVCPLNARETPPPAQDVLVLERVNAPLALIARADAPDAPRIELRELARQLSAPSPKA